MCLCLVQMKTNAHNWLGTKDEGSASMEILLQDNCQGTLQVLSGVLRVERG